MRDGRDSGESCDGDRDERIGEGMNSQRRAYVENGLRAGKALGGTVSAGQSHLKGDWWVGSGLGWERTLDRLFGGKSRTDFAFQTKIQSLYLKLFWNPGGL